MAPTTRSMDGTLKPPVPASTHHQQHQPPDDDDHPLPPSSSSSLTPTPPFFPPEVWSLVIHHLLDITLHSIRLYTSTLLSLTLANKQLHHLTTPHLYANPCLDKFIKEQWFWRTIIGHPAKWWQVRSLFIGERRWDPIIDNLDGGSRYKTEIEANGRVSCSIIAGAPKSHRVSPHVGRVGRAIALAGQKRNSHTVVEAGNHHPPFASSSSPSSSSSTTTTPSQHHHPYVASRSISAQWVIAFHLSRPPGDFPIETGPDPMLLEKVAWWEKGKYEARLNGHFYSTRPVGTWSEKWEKKKEEKIAREKARQAEMDRRRGGPIITFYDGSSDSTSSQESFASSKEDEDEKPLVASTSTSTSPLQTSPEETRSIPSTTSSNNATPRRLPWRYRLVTGTLDDSLFKLFYALDTLTHIELLIYPSKYPYTNDLVRLLRSLLRRSKMPLLESLLLIIGQDTPAPAPTSEREPAESKHATAIKSAADRVKDPRVKCVMSKRIFDNTDAYGRDIERAVKSEILYTWFEAVHGYDYACELVDEEEEEGESSTSPSVP